VCKLFIEESIFESLSESITQDLLVLKSAMSPMLSLTVPTVSCCLERPQRVHTPFNLVGTVTYLDHMVLTACGAVLMMAETCLLAEYAICYPALYDDLRAIQPRPTATTETVAIAAVAAAYEQNASAIIVLSTSGNTARLISKYRPKIPIITGL
jgi:hypothetical protein